MRAELDVARRPHGGVADRRHLLRLHRAEAIAEFLWLSMYVLYAVAAIAPTIAFGSAVLFMLVLIRLMGLLTRPESECVLAGATRSCEPLSVAMMDLDCFKQYNDAHGHHAGDEPLRSCTEAWKGALRPSDQLARLGGDEFALALPNCTLDRADEVVAGLRSRAPPEQSLSRGIARWDGDEPSDRLMIRADTALYAAGEQGRRRTVRAEPVDVGVSASTA